MKPSKCGVCNSEIPIDHVQLHRIEHDSSITSYCMSCEGRIKDIRPCRICGKHHLTCDKG